MKSITRHSALATCCVFLLLASQSWAYYVEPPASLSAAASSNNEQIEQKYESSEESETLQALSNDQSSVQQSSDQQQTSNSINSQDSSSSSSSSSSSVPTSTSSVAQSESSRLQEIYHRLASQAQAAAALAVATAAATPKTYQHHHDGTNTASASSYSHSFTTQEQSSQPSSDYGMYAQQPESPGLSKITQIPQGSLFAFPDKNGKLEFESMYAKQPYSIVFRTQSMPVKIKQQHQTMPAPEVEFVRSQEEAHRIKHEVIRPVIQEVHEIIQPYRRVVQEVRPVIENVHTIVAKGEGRGAGAGGAMGGGAMGGGAMGGGAMGAGIKGPIGAGRPYNDQISGSYSENRARFMVPYGNQPMTPKGSLLEPQPSNIHYRRAALRPEQQQLIMAPMKPSRSSRFLLQRRYL